MIAISYRRDDTAPITGRIYDRLEAVFGRDRVFMDLDSIPFGVDFRTHISESLNRCETLLVVIGPRWLGVSADGSRRIDDPTDFVRLEVSQALARDIRVIPLLIDRTEMPPSTDLPDDLKSLAFRNALRVDSGADFRHHMNRLCTSLGMTAEVPAKPVMTTGAPSGDSSVVPDQPPVRQDSGSRIVVAAVIAVVLIGAAEWYLEVENLVKSNKTWSRDWLFAPGVIWKLTIAALAMLAMATWITIGTSSRLLPGGGTAVERFKRALVSTPVWLVYAGPLIIFVMPLVAQYCAPEEPLAFSSGIGIWAGEMLHMVAFMLAIFFMFKAGIDLRANARWIEADFSFAPLPLTPFRWRDLGFGFEHWQMTERPRTSRFSAEEAWHAYLCRNKFWPRFTRIGVLFALYLLFSFAIYKLFPPPPAPAGGDMAFEFDRVVSFLSGASLLLLSFYVADAIQLNSNFIRMFGREVTKWSRNVVERSHRSPPLTDKELSAYYEIFFVAQRTQVVAPLIWYPLLVLTLLIIARSSFFDNSLFLICAITAAWALGSAISLRREAETLRAIGLNDLRRFRRLSLESEAKREAFDEIIAEIRDLKTGAFAPLTDQPFIRAVLFPGGAVGLLAVHQRLLNIF
jgi:TIR domain